MVMFIISVVIQFGPVLLLNQLVIYFQSGKVGLINPWVAVVLMGVLPVVVSVLQTQHSIILNHMAVFVRTGCCTLLYSKSLKVSPTGRARTDAGQVMNMMSNDTAQLQRFLQFLGQFMVAPLQIVIALVLIYKQVQNATWVGVGYMVALAPVNTLIFSVVGKMRNKALKCSDARVKMINEVLSGIRIIKFYAWEKPFGNEIFKIREKELEALTTLTYVSQIGFSVVLMSAPIVQPILVFLTYIMIQDEPLTPAKAFTTVALFNILRFPFAFLPMGLLQYIQSSISIRRLTRYLQLPDLEQVTIREPPPDAVDGSPETIPGSVTMKNCSFCWIDPDASHDLITGESKKIKPKKSTATNGNRKSSLFGKKTDSDVPKSDDSQETDLEASAPSDPAILKDISITIKAGDLVAVVGEVGCGKSSFLSAIFGEMEPLNGAKVYMPREEDDEKDGNFLGFCNQTPWVINETVKGNIVFGREFDCERYSQVVEACALKDDLAMLPAGDLTEIGERGINLSGGQKARVSLARAMYSPNTKLILLDDPLSAVDSHVGEHLFQKAISGELLAGTTRVLVTHHVHFLPRCDIVVVLENGRIKHCGSYDDLVAQGVDFAGAVQAVGNNEGDKEATEAAAESNIPAERIVTSAETDSSRQNAAKMKDEGKNLIADEERIKGSVDSSAYFNYARLGGMLIFGLSLFVQGCARAFELGAYFWLSYWSTETAKALFANNPFSESKTLQYLAIYSIFGIISIVCQTARSAILALHRCLACRKLHASLVSSILRAPISFFDVTPTGRILNRFAYDTDKVDFELSQTLNQVLNCVFSILGSIAALIVATKGTFLVPLVPITWLYYLVQKWFRMSNRELQRITSITGSPIFAGFSETLSGTTTIRAFNAQDDFFSRCKSLFATTNAAFTLVQFANLWLSLRLDVLGGIVSIFIAGVAVVTYPYGFISAGWLGLALSFSIDLNTFLKFGVRMLATLEADLTSVERILYYSNNIEQEAPDVIPDKDPKIDSWPTQGQITVENASMRYRDGPLVLKNLSFTIKGGEKIGVVGRTGSGKSSLMIALFRITELEKNGGKILVDNVNVSEIGTDCLRTSLSIIPQDPVLFSNTVRYNLDPFSTKSDEELWDSLVKVRLGEVVASLPLGLEEPVAEGGENFSQGQRQLLCIARSLLRNPKILVMDEATASIDNTTDGLIQEMVRSSFANATVLTIAHRLNTIMDSDRILVLQKGEVAEFDTPKSLLSRKDSVFYGMVEESKKASNRGSSVNLAALEK